jgi:hypothetical protein
VQGFRPGSRSEAERRRGGDGREGRQGVARGQDDGGQDRGEGQGEEGPHLPLVPRRPAGELASSLSLFFDRPVRGLRFGLNSKRPRRAGPLVVVFEWFSGSGGFRARVSGAVER